MSLSCGRNLRTAFLVTPAVSGQRHTDSASFSSKSSSFCPQQAPKSFQPCVTQRAVLQQPRCSTADALSRNSSRAVIWDCDGVIVLSEELHRVCYNSCFKSEGLGFEWSQQFYDMLQNSIGGGKEKMRWYFGKYGWPNGEETDEERAALINHLQDKKTGMYLDLMSSGDVKPRTGVLELMDAALDAGYRMAICSAATKEAVEMTLDRLLGKERLARFDLVLAGAFNGDKTLKKPDPMIYNVASEKMQISPTDCVVIEDSQIGLQAALAANMRCIVAHTPSTKSQTFEGADVVLPGLDEVSLDMLFPIETLK